MYLRNKFTMVIVLYTPVLCTSDLPFHTPLLRDQSNTVYISSVWNFELCGNFMIYNSTCYSEKTEFRFKSFNNYALTSECNLIIKFSSRDRPEQFSPGSLPFAPCQLHTGTQQQVNHSVRSDLENHYQQASL